MDKEEALQQKSLLEQMEELLLQYQQLADEMITEMEQGDQSKK